MFNKITGFMSKLTYEEDVASNLYADFHTHLEQGHFFRAKQCVAIMREYDEHTARRMDWELRGEVGKNL